jgi:hypothetical protein
MSGREEAQTICAFFNYHSNPTIANKVQSALDDSCGLVPNTD